MKNNIKEYESENVGVRFIEPVKEPVGYPSVLTTGRQASGRNPTPKRIRGRQVKN